LQAILAKFREDMALRNFSDNTRKQYERVWRFYTARLRERGRDLAHSDESDIREYALHLTARGLKPATADNCR
jgi:site-specific recombinase XerD